MPERICKAIPRRACHKQALHVDQEQQLDANNDLQITERKLIKMAFAPLATFTRKD